jgi:glycine cleavage system H protein
MEDTFTDGCWRLDYIQTDECDSGCPTANAACWTLRPSDLAHLFWVQFTSHQHSRRLVGEGYQVCLSHVHEEICMPDFLETTVDKFIFKVATDRHYNAEEVWAKAEGNRVQVGVSDFLQQRSGDVAFAEVKPQGTKLTVGDEVATIETIKVNISLPSPVNGRVIEVNPAMETTPELINKDPYGEGWLAVVEVADWSSERARLLNPQAYFELMKGQAEEEAKKQ